MTFFNKQSVEENTSTDYLCFQQRLFLNLHPFKR